MATMKPAIEELAVARGIEPGTIRQWRHRGAVPHRERLPILQAAEKRGLKIKPSDFEFEAKPRRRSKREAA
jgi:hypothetical protein